MVLILRSPVPCTMLSTKASTVCAVQQLAVGRDLHFLVGRPEEDQAVARRTRGLGQRMQEMIEQEPDARSS
jgi:hypothetical protein